MTKSYQMCTRCVMDTSDVDITFNEKGECNHCTRALEWDKQGWLPDARGKFYLEQKLDAIRKTGRGREYDCIIGLSGGTDSSYLAYKAKDWGLRPLLFHVDGGWNTPESENNVQKLADYHNIPLQRYVVDWEEMRDLQRAFLQSGVPNQDIPQDHLFFAVLYNLAEKMRLSYWLSGSNFVSESILAGSWGYNAMDVRHLKAIHAKFGTKSLRTFPTLSFRRYCKYYLQLGKVNIERVDPLNWIPYDVFKAREELAVHCGWQDYGRKHGESYFTRYFQNYYLPTRFGFDKRKAHYSSCIVSEIMTRNEALDRLQEPLYSQEDLDRDTTHVREKLGYSEQEWDAVISSPTKAHNCYANNTFASVLACRARPYINAFDDLRHGDFAALWSKISKKLL